MNLLLTGAFSCTQEMREELACSGHRIFFLQQEKDPLPCRYEEIEGVVCNGLFLHHPIEKFTALKFIQLTSAGLDRVDTDYIAAHGIALFSARGVYSIPMAEFAVGGILTLYKHIKTFAENQKNKRWEKQRNLSELYGKTVCIVGCGSVGCEVARRFLAFGTRVIGVDLYPREDAHFEKIHPLEDLNTALGESDVVILTLPLTKQTEKLFDRARFDRMKNGAHLVNIARGGIVDSDALIDALQNKKLGGAVLDVFENEPLCENSPLWDMDNVLITPHNSFAGEKNAARLFTLAKNNLMQYEKEARTC